MDQLGPTPLILLVEDEPPMRRFLRAALTSNDYRLVEAATAKEGLAHAATQPRFDPPRPGTPRPGRP